MLRKLKLEVLLNNIYSSLYVVQMFKLSNTIVFNDLLVFDNLLAL